MLANLETILAGKAKVMVAGGFDNHWEEGHYEFGKIPTLTMTITSIKNFHSFSATSLTACNSIMSAG
jgi:3-oxoacyl-(acyl-carrier-protein) synthase